MTDIDTEMVEVPAEDTEPTETVEDRVTRLEYLVSRVKPEHFNPRAPFTNPIDDPDDPPFETDDKGNPTRSGSWEGHPWHGVTV